MLKSLVSRVMAQSDLTHATLAVGSSALLLPLLPSLAPSSISFLHLASLSTALGTHAYVSFVSGPTMFLNMPRTAFGDIQSRLFPKMGQLCTSANLVTLATYGALHHSLDTPTILLATSLLMNALNTFYVFNKSAELMQARRKTVEGTEERKAADRAFGMVHGVSVLVNFAALGAGLGYTYILAERIAGVW